MGLTGSIASGKSSVLRAFKKLGWKVISADEIVHEIYEEHSLKIQELRQRALQSKAALTKLEGFVHPLVRKKILAELQVARGRAIVEIPLLFESRYSYPVDKTIFVYCPRALRLARAKKRGMSAALFRKLEARQLRPSEKAKRADWIIHNISTPAFLTRQCKWVSDTITSDT